MASTILLEFNPARDDQGKDKKLRDGLVGSHSLKRRNPGSADGARKVRKQLAKVSATGNRFLLARIPIVKRQGTYTLAKEVARRGKSAVAADVFLRR